MLSSQAYLSRSCSYHFRRAYSRVVNLRDRWLDPPASAFIQAMRQAGFDPDTYIDVLPSYRLIYICVPKSASSTVRSALSALDSSTPPPPGLLYKRRYSGLNSPAQVGISAFHRLAKSASTLRFSFVRNPYARLLSAWADKFQGKPLVAGDSFIDQYLTHSAAAGGAPPSGPHETLSFPQFAEFAIATAPQRINAHWQLQRDFVAVPGIKLDLIGKVETFSDDFNRVIEHIGAGERIRQAGGMPLNKSPHRPWQDYYTDALADRVYRAYEADFDQFGYPRAIAKTALA